MESCADPLPFHGSGGLVIFGLLRLVRFHAQGFFQECGGLFTVGSLKTHCFDLDFAGGMDADFDGSFHAFGGVMV